MMNPKAWETINGFTANAKAATERLGKLIAYFPENTQQLTEAATRIEALCDATMKSLLTEALTGVGTPAVAPVRETPFPVRKKAPAVTIAEAAGKRIRELTVDGGDDPDLNSFGVSLFFDDDTWISLDLRAVLSCGVEYLHVEAERPIKEYPHRLLVHEQ
jgi:hypothetical protein